MLCSLVFPLPFLHNIKNYAPPSEACLYGNINWLLAQAHQQSSLGLSQSSTSVKSARAKPQVGFLFNVLKQPVLEYGGASLAKKPHLDAKPASHQGARKSAGGAYLSFTHPSKKGSYGGWHSWCVTVFDFITIILICCACCYTLKFLRSMVKHYFKLVCASYG